LSAAIVEELELIWMCCGWCTPPTTHSNQFQLFHDSSRQHYGVTVTRSCSYSCFCASEDGWYWNPKHVEQLSDKNKLCDMCILLGFIY